MRHADNKSMYLLLLAVVLLLGAFLRIWGIGFGLPIKSSLYIRPDESLLVQPALHMVERRGDRLGEVERPGPNITVELIRRDLVHAAQSSPPVTEDFDPEGKLR